MRGLNSGRKPVSELERQRFPENRQSASFAAGVVNLSADWRLTTHQQLRLHTLGTIPARSTVALKLKGFLMFTAVFLLLDCFGLSRREDQWFETYWRVPSL